VDDLAARRRRAILGAIMVVAFALLVVAALIPSPRSRPLALEQAGADETVPETATSAPAPTPSVAPSTTTTSTAAPTTTTTEAPATTTTTAEAKVTSVVKAATTPPKTTAPVTTAPPAPAPSPGPSDAAFLACIRMRESHNDYTAVSSSGNYRGAYQFNQPAWDSTATHAGRPDLVGRLANTVAPADQDAMALDLYHWQGAKPWNYACT
jgi:cytoskeletal protein RodZ